jgi:methionyl-tRNA formyltransferase
MKKLFIATSREIGVTCRDWVKANLPKGWEMSYDIDDCDVLISVLYDKILTPDYIKKHKCFNFHPGSLPEYRGAATYSWAIVNGEDKAGVTLHLIFPGIDDGDVIEIRQFPISDKDTAESVFRKAELVIFRMFKDWLPRLLAGEYEAYPQNENNARIYYRKDLEKIKNLTKYVRALHFKGKESAYYINDKGDKIYIRYDEEN